MSTEVKELTQSQLVDNLRDIVAKSSDNVKDTFEEKLQALDSYNREKAEKINKRIEELDDENQKLTLALKNKEKESEEFSQRIEGLEKSLVNKGNNLDLPLKEQPEYKALNKLVRLGNGTLSQEEKSLLRSDIGADGAVLMPELFNDVILKNITEISPVRQVSRVRTIQTKTLKVPGRNRIPVARFAGEAEEIATSSSKYELITLTAHRQGVTTEETKDVLNFSEYDMESETGSDAVTAFAESEGRNFILGDGVEKPQGILDDSTGIEIFDSSAPSGTVSFDEIITLSGNLKTGYNPVYFFNRKTLANLRVKKDGNNQYLWTSGAERMPSTINEIPYLVMPDMPDFASQSLSIGIGDFFRGYMILDAKGLELIRDDLKQKTRGIVEFYWERYLDGRVVRPEAFKLLRSAA